MEDSRKNNPENVMTVQEVSAYLKIPVSTLYDLTRKGKLRGVKVGRQWRYLERDILAYLYGTPNLPRTPSLDSERRQHSRMNTKIPAALTCLADDFNSSNHGVVGNLSEGGALFVCDSGNGSGRSMPNKVRLEVGDPAKIIFEISENGASTRIQVNGRIVHLGTNSEVRAGVKFRNLSSKDREVIQDYVG